MTSLTALRSLDDLPGPRGLPGIGSALALRGGRLHLTAERWCAEYGPLFRFDLGSRPVVGVGDAETINDLLRRRPDEFRRWSEIEQINIEMRTHGVFSAEGDDWRRMRRLAVTALNSDRQHRYFEVIRTAGERLVARLEAGAQDGRPIAIVEDFKAFAMDVTLALAFGCDPSNEPRRMDDLRRDVDVVFEGIGRRLSAPVPYWRWVGLPADRVLAAALARLRAAVGEYIEAARARMRDRPETHHQPENFLESMIAAQEAEGRYSEDELFGNAMTMLLAGVDTTALTLGWAAWYLASNPVVSERLAGEADELLGEDDIPADYETVARAGYAEAVLKEALRLKPAAVTIFLEAIDDAVIGDLQVPAGTRLLLLTRNPAHQAGNFARPRHFDPDRWLAAPEGAHDAKAFLPFGAGPRFCPGRNLALLEAKLALVVLARHFEVSIEPAAAPVTEHFAFTMAPRGLGVRLLPRAAGAPRA